MSERIFLRTIERRANKILIEGLRRKEAEAAKKEKKDEEEEEEKRIFKMHVKVVKRNAVALLATFLGQTMEDVMDDA